MENYTTRESFQMAYHIVRHYGRNSHAAGAHDQEMIEKAAKSRDQLFFRSPSIRIRLRKFKQSK